MTQARWLEHQNLPALIDVLRSQGFRVVGPTIEQNAIVYEELTSIQQLPQGWSDSQSPAIYQIQRTPQSPENQKYFHFNLGPHSWKKFLFPPHSLLSNESASTPNQPLAILGARACELAAIAIQDRVFMTPPSVDPQYARRRNDLFVVALQCTTAASTCFCPSMNTGPALPTPNENSSSYDIALTEIASEEPGQVSHGFVVQAGSPSGQLILDQLPTTAVTADRLHAQEQIVDSVRSSIERAMPSGDLREALLARLKHPHWEDVAKRCLSCANCTMVCPTCFCSSVDETHDLLNDTTLRERRWDSCFNPDFTHTSGAPARNSIQSRYRQWLTHKLATWFDQFDTSGCVGCGRCITWCPVGIDLTQEVAKLLEPSDAPLLSVPPKLHHPQHRKQSHSLDNLPSSSSSGAKR
jgi:Fe-S-cluster-containing hydrogenase component 2